MNNEKLSKLISVINIEEFDRVVNSAVRAAANSPWKEQQLQEFRNLMNDLQDKYNDETLVSDGNDAGLAACTITSALIILIKAIKALEDDQPE